MTLFVRFGDQSDYLSLPDLQALLCELVERSVSAVWWHDAYGIAGEGFAGNNYISVYYGESVESAPVRGLNSAELRWLNSRLNTLVTYPETQ